jgi:hypothetical protein
MATDRCGVTWSVEEWTDTTCRLVMHRPNWQPIPVEWTIEDAKRANLVGKSNWKSYPRAMLFNRALAQGVRAIAPDHFVGVYDQDELGADVNEVRAASVGRTAVDEMTERLLSAPAAETEDTDEPQGSLV